jgi:hypothetical protein
MSPQITFPHSLHAFSCAAVMLLMTTSSWAQNNYAAFELRREDNWRPIVMEDVDGDGGKDLIVSNYLPELGRELYIYHQQADGSFNAEPQRIEIKTEVIAVGFADLRPDPGMELVLFANNAVFSLSTASAGYTNNLKLLFQWDLIAAIPNLERVLFSNIPTDINNDGEVDFLVPGNDEYGVFLGQGNEEFDLALRFSTLNQGITPVQRVNSEAELDANLSINSEQGVVVELNLQKPTPFQGFVEQWDPAAVSSDALLDSEQWMPTAVLAQLNDDDLLDLTYINVGDAGLGQMNVHYQDPVSGFKPEPDWSQPLDSSGELELVDMNNDGQQDLLRLAGDGSDWSARLFLNEAGRFNFEQPNQIMRFSGYDVELNVIQLRDGGLPTLNVSYYTIPVVDAIRNASINRVQLLYGSAERESGQVFNRRPDSRLEESFSAENVRGLSEQMSLLYDVDGDGNKDALYVTENGTLAAKSIDAGMQIADQPFWEYVSSRSVFEFEVMQLNDDAKPDLLLRHGVSTTLLVAQP